MAHTVHDRSKGCRARKPYKLRGLGQAKRKPVAELRRIGKRRRVVRHELGTVDERAA